MSFLHGHVFEGRTPFQKKTPKQQNKRVSIQLLMVNKNNSKEKQHLSFA